MNPATKDLILIFFSVFLSIFFGQNIIKSISDRILIFARVLLTLDFRDRLRALSDPSTILNCGQYSDFQIDLKKCEQSIEKSIRCNVSISIWLLFSFFLMFFLKHNGLITENFFTLLKLLIFFGFFLYLSYFCWITIDAPKEKFSHNKENVNTLSRHNLLIVFSMLAIPFVTGNYKNWGVYTLVAVSLTIPILIWSLTRVYRTLCVHRFEREKNHSKIFYLSGVKIEAGIYIFFFIALLAVLELTSSLLNIEISEREFRNYSLFLCFAPWLMLGLKLFLAVGFSSIFNFFFNRRITLKIWDTRE